MDCVNNIVWYDSQIEWLTCYLFRAIMHLHWIWSMVTMNGGLFAEFLVLGPLQKGFANIKTWWLHFWSLDVCAWVCVSVCVSCAEVSRTFVRRYCCIDIEVRMSLWSFVNQQISPDLNGDMCASLSTCMCVYFCPFSEYFIVHFRAYATHKGICPPVDQTQCTMWLKPQISDRTVLLLLGVNHTIIPAT